MSDREKGGAGDAENPDNTDIHSRVTLNSPDPATFENLHDQDPGKTIRIRPKSRPEQVNEKGSTNQSGRTDRADKSPIPGAVLTAIRETSQSEFEDLVGNIGASFDVPASASPAESLSPETIAMDKPDSDATSPESSPPVSVEMADETGTFHSISHESGDRLVAEEPNPAFVAINITEIPANPRKNSNS